MSYRQKGDWLNWSIPAGRISGVSIGIHWTFPLFVLIYTLQAGRKESGEWAFVVLVSLLLLWGIVLAHEFGHVLAARREGILADRITLWPLGGLAHLGQETTGRSEVRIAAAGPAVNLLFAVLLLPVLVMLGIEIGGYLLNPFVWGLPRSGDLPQQIGHAVYKANLVVLLFNLMPAFPMDGGRILRGLLHRRLGYLHSTIAVTTVAFVLVGVFIMWAIFAESNQLLLVLIAAFVALGAYQMRRQAKMILAPPEQEAGFMGYDFTEGQTSLARTAEQETRGEQRRKERERRKRERAEEDGRRIEEQVDALLEKISREGMDSLTRKERAFLEKASRRKR